MTATSKAPFLLAITGSSGSGKTTLIEQLIPLLKEGGLSVNVIKSSHHDVTIEPPHKDSARFRTAGADEVMLASPYRYMIVRELTPDVRVSFDEVLSRLTLADITLVEGFRNERLKKLEVYRPSHEKDPEYPDNPDIVAVASDVPKPKKLPRSIHWFDINSPQNIATWIIENNYF